MPQSMALSLDDAKRVAASARVEAKKNGWDVAVVDDCDDDRRRRIPKPYGLPRSGRCGAFRNSRECDTCRLDVPWDVQRQNTTGAVQCGA
jgi:hypothetical protein